MTNNYLISTAGIALMSISLSAFVLRAVSRPTQAMPAPCPLYYASEVQKLEEQIIMERKKHVPAIYKYVRTFPSPYQAFSQELEVWKYAVQSTLKHEGGYAIDNNGYPVNYGINQAFYRPPKGYPKKVKHLTRSQAISYYKLYYWNPLNLNPAYSATYRAFIFDTAVNKGVKTALKIDAEAKGNLKKALQLRKGHIYRWACRSKANKPYLKALIQRVNSYV